MSLTTDMSNETSTNHKFNSIFAVDSIIEYKYQNKKWLKGVIYSYSRANEITIDLEISKEKFEKINILYSKAMTHTSIHKH